MNKGGKFDKSKGGKATPKKFNGECSDTRRQIADKAKREAGGEKRRGH